MTIYTYSEARQNFATVLDKARAEGKVLIKRKDGSVFMIQPVSQKGSPLEVKGLDLDISAGEIIDILREIREK
ncbi:MAG: type II toxin-antitoxin system Phd/YefM family antitoxin [Candidatus Aminicenantes bacterium]|nr:type II toxin-antitoxin system Phd/YefM family antitoxin [Candidatus Aminicenantes bacterium]